MKIKVHISSQKVGLASNDIDSSKKSSINVGSVMHMKEQYDLYSVN